MIWRCRLDCVDDVEVDQAERADAGGGEIERERRAEAAGADAEDLRGLQLLLAFHADFGQDEVARVAGDLFVGELGERRFRRASRLAFHVSSRVECGHQDRPVTNTD